MAVVLTLDAALEGCGAGLVVDGVAVAERRYAEGRGSAAVLPALAAAVLRGFGAPASVAVVVGPGSFTGVRAALALALGIGLAAGIPVLGATVGEAIRASHRGARRVWVAVNSRRGRVFLDDGESVFSVAVEAVPLPGGPIAVAGDGGAAVASRLLARGFDVQLLSERRPTPAGIAAAAGRPAMPLYVDPPEARPGPGVRPAPV